MNVKYKEDPREWRKTTCLTAVGLAALSSVLRWRRHLPVRAWEVVLGLCAAVVIAAFIRPAWFRPYYRFSQKLGFHLSQFIGRLVLAAFFIFILTPIGLIRRAMSHDPLRLKRPAQGETCWQTAKPPTPLERLF